MRIDGRTLSHETSETIRRLAVRRVQEGERPSSVIESYGLCRTTIYKWLRTARRGGEAARAVAGARVDRRFSRVGAPPRLTISGGTTMAIRNPRLAEVLDYLTAQRSIAVDRSARSI